MAKKPEWLYQQCAVVPLVEQDGETLVVLITSSRSGRWGIPKGVIEKGLTPQESVAIEAWEEAGLRGTILDEQIGAYEYKKWGGVCKVAVYTMRVEEVVDDFPEKNNRQRKIVNLTEAGSLVANKDVSSILHQLR